MVEHFIFGWYQHTLDLIISLILSLFAETEETRAKFNDRDSDKSLSSCSEGSSDEEDDDSDDEEDGSSTDEDENEFDGLEDNVESDEEEDHTTSVSKRRVKSRTKMKVRKMTAEETQQLR